MNFSGLIRTHANWRLQLSTFCHGGLKEAGSIQTIEKDNDCELGKVAVWGRTEVCFRFNARRTDQSPCCISSVCCSHRRNGAKWQAEGSGSTPELQRIAICKAITSDGRDSHEIPHKVRGLINRRIIRPPQLAGQGVRTLHEQNIF
jgi:hypothetical protein